MPAYRETDPEEFDERRGEEVDRRPLVSVDNSLVGSFFHTLIPTDDGPVLGWEGQVLSNPEPGWYLVARFGWTKGEASVYQLVRIEAMADWFFYVEYRDLMISRERGFARPYRLARKRWNGGPR